jgi:predicted nucleic acid-binding protein
MKAIVFDSSSIITLAMNNLLWILEPLKEKFGGDFYISHSVREEIIDNPLHSKKFKLEALQVMEIIDKGILTIYGKNLLKDNGDVLDNPNRIFEARGHRVKILHSGEIGALLLAKELNAEAFVIDERTTRLLVESPREVAKVLKSKMHTPIKINGKYLDQFQESFKDLKVLRSVDLGYIAYKMGLLDNLLLHGKKDLETRKQLLDGMLWAMKLRGCSITDNEIKDYVEKFV